MVTKVDIYMVGWNTRAAFVYSKCESGVIDIAAGSKQTDDQGVKVRQLGFHHNPSVILN